MKKYKTIIYIVLAVIVVGLLIYFVFIPQINSILLIWTKNSIKQNQISTLQKEKADLDKLKQEEVNAENLSNALIVILPDKKDTGRFIINVEALAKNTNTDFSDIKFSEEKKTTQASTSSEDTSTKKSNVKAVNTSTSKFKELTVEMTVKGSYTDVINFLKGLEKINRAISIEKADLSQVLNVIQASIKGKIYYKND
ncbi:MAG: GspMb/PilO family protein [Candidatus Berkelbacteria bacterium]|nr:GspMb/PilO family protein [Candidatus Berkelbacteria bacterium]